MRGIASRWMAILAATAALGACGGGGGGGGGGGTSAGGDKGTNDSFIPGVAFVTANGDYTESRLQVSDFEGTEIREIAKAGWVSDIQWSPNRTAISYRTGEPDGQSEHLWVAAAKGKSAPQEIGTTSSSSRTIQNVLWSPDSQWLSYAIVTSGPNLAELYLCHVPTKTPYLLSSTLHAGFEKWAPNSSAIAWRETVAPLSTTNLRVWSTTSRQVVPIVEGVYVYSIGWSPDSSMLAYVTNYENSVTGYALQILDCSSLQQTYAYIERIPASSSFDPDPTSLPLAIVGLAANEPPERMWRWLPDSKKIACISVDSLVVLDVAKKWIIPGGMPALSFDVAAKGSKIALLSSFNSPGGDRVLFSYDLANWDSAVWDGAAWKWPDGSSPFQVVSAIPKDNGWLYTNPVMDYAWSPDGSKIAWRGSDSSLFVSQMPTSVPSAYSFAWSPNGKHIVLSDLSTDEGLVAVVDAASGVQIPHKGLTKMYEHPWSSDGSRLAFIDANSGDLRVVKPNSEGEVTIAINVVAFALR